MAMFSISGRPYRLCDGLSRREVLRVGAAGLAGVTLPNLFRLQKAGAADPDKPISVINMWLAGGPSHLETFDPKPEAPQEIRGPFGAIDTNVAGFRLSELLPHLAQRADKFALVRTMAHTHNDHDASQWMLSGYFYTPTATVLQYPSMGSVFTRLNAGPGDFPPYWHMPIYGKFVVNAPEGFGAGYLGHKFDPLLVDGDPNRPGFTFRGLALPGDMDPTRFTRRLSLLETVEQSVRHVEQTNLVDGVDENYQKAFSLITSAKVREAFAIDNEDPRTRDRYGRSQFGQNTLLARRLIEVGARFVNVRWPGRGFAWDTHSNNFNGHKNTLVPPVDQALSALLDDLDARGLLDTTLVLCMGEFGRTPKINANAGRDHWQYCYSIAAAGAGIQGGQVIGASDAQGAHPRTRPFWPHDLCATIYHLLGVDWQQSLPTNIGRALPILPARSEPIWQLFG
jgi:hypothetical protein